MNEVNQISSFIYQAYIMAYNEYKKAGYDKLKYSHSLPWIRSDRIARMLQENIGNETYIIPNGSFKPFALNLSNGIYTFHRSYPNPKYKKSLISLNDGDNIQRTMFDRETDCTNSSYIIVVHEGFEKLEQITFYKEFSNSRIDVIANYKSNDLEELSTNNEMPTNKIEEKQINNELDKFLKDKKHIKRNNKVE